MEWRHDLESVCFSLDLITCWVLTELSNPWQISSFDSEGTLPLGGGCSEPPSKDWISTGWIWLVASSPLKCCTALTSSLLSCSWSCCSSTLESSPVFFLPPELTWKRDTHQFCDVILFLPLVFAYCKQSKTGGGMGMRLAISASFPGPYPPFHYLTVWWQKVILSFPGSLSLSSTKLSGYEASQVRAWQTTDCCYTVKRLLPWALYTLFYTPEVCVQI